MNEILAYLIFCAVIYIGIGTGWGFIRFLTIPKRFFTYDGEFFSPAVKDYLYYKFCWGYVVYKWVNEHKD